MVHAVAKNVGLRLAKSRQRDADLVGGVIRSYGLTVDGENDVSRTHGTPCPRRHRDHEQTTLAPLAQIARELSTNGHQAQTCDVERSALLLLTHHRGHAVAIVSGVA